MLRAVLMELNVGEARISHAEWLRSGADSGRKLM